MENEEKIENESLTQAKVQTWLEEHRALRNEIEQHHVSMRHMTIFNITASGTIFSLVFLNNELVPLLLLIPVLSSILGFIFFFHSKRMSQLGHYIQKVIAPNIRKLLNNDSLLAWEDNIREQESKGYSKSFSLDGVRLLTFLLTSLLALSGAVSINLYLQFLPTWLIGLALTVVLIILTIIERKLWFGTQKE
jgi:hypothetical protein